MNPEIGDDTVEPASKTRLKQLAHEQQQLGQRLTTLKPNQLLRLNLPEQLLRAIEEFKRLPNSFGARKRQLQFIGKLMRDVDSDSLEERLANVETSTLPEKESRTDSEAMATAILEQGDEAIETTIQTHPSLQRQSLRQFSLEYQRARGEKRDKIKFRLIKHLASYLDQ